MQDDIAEIVATIPPLEGFRGEARRLGGLTNRVYRLGDRILRIPGAGTEAYIDREREAAMAGAAAAAGVAPPLVWARPWEPITAASRPILSRSSAGRSSQALARSSRRRLR